VGSVVCAGERDWVTLAGMPLRWEVVELAAGAGLLRCWWCCGHVSYCAIGLVRLWRYCRVHRAWIRERELAVEYVWICAGECRCVVVIRQGWERCALSGVWSFRALSALRGS